MITRLSLARLKGVLLTQMIMMIPSYPLLPDDALIVSRMKSSRMKSSSLLLILEIAKEELSYTGVVPATESPMPKSEGVNQKKLC